MKKLLSIFAIGGGILGSTLPTVTACKPKPKPKPIPSIAKFNLNQINIFKTMVTKSMTAGNNFGKLQINVTNVYNRIKTVIIDEYNAQKYKDVQTLKSSDFTYGAKTDKTHSWAIEIINGNNIAMAKPTSATEKTNIFSKTAPATGIILKNNALKIKIVTTNKNVEKTTAPSFAHAYLNKLVYSGANINQGTNIYDGNTMPTAAALKTAFDVSSDTGITLTKTKTAEATITEVEAITGNHQTNISKTVLDALNTQLSSETKYLTDLGILSITGKINFGATTNQILYKIDAQDHVTAISSTTELGANSKFYVRIGNLGLANYIGNLNSFLYLYLGATGS